MELEERPTVTVSALTGNTIRIYIGTESGEIMVDVSHSAVRVHNIPSSVSVQVEP